MLNPWILLGLLAAWVGSIAAAGYTAYGAGQDKCIAEQARDIEVANIASEAAASATAQAISKIKVQNRTIQNEVQREVIEKPVYRDAACQHDPRILRSLNAALTGEGSESAGGIKLPATDAFGRPLVRGNDAQAGGSGRPVPGMPEGGAQ